MTKNKFFFALASIAFAGCIITDNSNDTDNADTGNGTGQTSAQTTVAMTAGETAGESAGETVGADTAVADSGSGGADTGGGGMYCVQGCMTPADCCAMGTEGMCPGDYPYNVECNDGVCSSPGCAPSDDCTFGGALPGFECHDIGGFGACLPVCADDGECLEGETCTGMADDGTTYCVLPPCTSDDECTAPLTCDLDSGLCVGEPVPTCADDSECDAGFVCR